MHTNPVCGFAHLWQEPWQRGRAELFAGGQSSKFKPFSTSQLRPLPAGYTLRLAEQNQLGWCQPRLCRVGPRAAFEGLHSPCSEGVGRVPVFLTTHWGRRIFLPKICPCVTQLRTSVWQYLRGHPRIQPFHIFWSLYKTHLPWEASLIQQIPGDKGCLWH